MSPLLILTIITVLISIIIFAVIRTRLRYRVMIAFGISIIFGLISAHLYQSDGGLIIRIMASTFVMAVITLTSAAVSHILSENSKSKIHES